MTTPTTRTDAAGANGWDIGDKPNQLREWGTNITHLLPSGRNAGTIGAAEHCWLRLWDPSGRISRTHAVLAHDGEGWRIEDQESKNGVYVNGIRVRSLSLVPGAEIRIGSFTLIVESPKLIALRESLERILGWADERREEVDHALASLRIAVTHREPLLLCGARNLASTARLLHQRAFGHRPFVVFTSAFARGIDAHAAAAGGTLCINRHQQPDDFGEVVSAVRGPVSQTFLMVCARTRPRGGDIASQIVTIVRSILVPPLADRGRELHRVIDEYAADAILAFGTGGITVADRQWIAHNASGSLHQIHVATRRIVALHACGENVTHAANLLGMAHASLSGWLARRTLNTSPMIDEDDDGTDEGEA